jgi:hypothetical protein
VLNEISVVKAAVLEAQTPEQAEFLRRHAAKTVSDACRLCECRRGSAPSSPLAPAQQQSQQRPQVPQQQRMALVR